LAASQWTSRAEVATTWRRTFPGALEGTTVDVINLRRVRKRAAKQRDDERAAANRTRHGRSKPQRLVESSQADKSRRDFDAHKIEPGESQ